MFRYADKNRFLLPEIARRLKTILKGGPFKGIHIFTPHGDIPDDTDIRLVVLPPPASHFWKLKDTMAIRTAQEIIKKRGKQPRLNQNRLIFMCADTDATASVYDNAKRYLAWKSIISDKHALNLDQHRIKEATIAQEIIQHFSGKVGAEVNITVDIQAEYAKGFDDSTRRTVKENSNTLNFNIAEFEDE